MARNRDIAQVKKEEKVLVKRENELRAFLYSQWAIIQALYSKEG
jgi:hypothetical protein